VPRILAPPLEANPTPSKEEEYWRGSSTKPRVAWNEAHVGARYLAAPGALPPPHPHQARYPAVHSTLAALVELR